MIVSDSQRALTNHVRVRLQFLFTPFRELVITGEPGNEATIRSQDLDPIIFPIRNIDVAISIYTDTARAVAKVRHVICCVLKVKRNHVQSR